MNKTIEFFNNLAENWDEISKANDENIGKILGLTDLKEGAKILDVACGTGVLEPFFMEYKPKEILGVDIAPKMIEIAKEKFKTDSAIEFKCMDVLDLKEGDFDLVMVHNAFPHFEDGKALISHLRGLLKKGGKLVICHSFSRKGINSHHDEHAKDVSSSLKPASEVAELFEDFTIENIVDSDIYYICGINK